MTGGCAFNGALDVRFEEWVSNDHEPIIMATARDWDPTWNSLDTLTRCSGPRGDRHDVQVIDGRDGAGRDARRQQVRGQGVVAS